MSAESAGPDERRADNIAPLTVVRLVAVITILSLPVVFDRQAIAEAAALYPVESSASSYWVPAHALLLYVRAPAVVLSACILVLTPGLLLALAADLTRTLAAWVLTSFLLSLLVVSTAAGVVQGVLGRPLLDGPFVATVAACSVGSLLLLCYVIARRRPLTRPWTMEGAGPTVAAMIAASVLLLVALAPKFYWDSFNGDGAHTFESARLLLTQPVPFWGRSAGSISTFPGMTSVLYIYPVSWFLRLFGGIEAAVRVPWVLFLAVLFCAIVTVAEHGRRSLGGTERALIWLGLMVYAVTMAYSATYNPYSADIALPATQDTLLMAMFLAYVFYFIEGRRSLMVLAVVYVALSLPSGALLITLWLGAVMLWQRRPWSRVVQSVVVLLACMVAGALVPRVLPALHLPAPGTEYDAASLRHYLVGIHFGGWRRLLYFIVPGGIVPALAIVAWKRHDRVARSLAVVTVGYFALFFVQGHIALHHFVPAMLLPLAMFWRTAGDLSATHRRAVLAVVAGGGLVALVVSLPRNAGPQLVSREVGFTVEDRTAGYARSDPASFRRAQLFTTVFPAGWSDSVPDRSFGGAALVWFYYAHHAPPGGPPANYVLQPPQDPPPPRSRLIAVEGDAALYVRDDSVWARQLALRPPTPAGSPLYWIPRRTLFMLGHY